MKQKFVFMWAEENYNYYEFEPILLNYGLHSKQRWGYGIDNCILSGKDFQAECYLPESELKKEAENWYNFFINNQKFESYLNAIKESSNDLLNEIKMLLTVDLSQLNSEELFVIYHQYYLQLGKLFNCYIVSQPHRVAKLEKELSAFLKEKSTDIPHDFSVLTTHSKKIIFSGTGNKLFSGSFMELLGKESSIIDKSLISKEMFHEEQADISEKKRLISQLKPQKKMIKIIETISILGHERFRMRFVWMPALYYSEFFLVEFKRRYNVSKSELRAYDTSEIENLIRFDKKINPQTIALRKEGFLKYLTDGKIRTYEGKKANQLLSKLINKTELTTELEGMVASKGHAVGKVLILSYRNSKEHSAKIKKMRKGDIIVTEMTRPNILTACENAGAIITDEGGILCHASIVSRELGIPCVIGTKEATSYLKDGDYVEVDAVKGRVRKISLKEYNSKKHDAGIKVADRAITKKVTLNKLKIGNIFWFKDISLKDIPTVGGKGASLGELSQIVTVPSGFCVTVNAYHQFLVEHKLEQKIKSLLRGISVKNVEQLEEKAHQIREVILNKQLSSTIQNEILTHYRALKNKKVAIRSSATAEDLPNASFAGQQDTYLNISKEEEVLCSIKKCWASLFTSRAIYYREKNKFEHTKVLISVVVQEMVDAAYAGVIFTKDPIEKKYVLIEVVKGLGEKLVSGEVTPNTYHLQLNGSNIVQKRENFKFDQTHLMKLKELGKIIEKHYKSPQDIEWAIDKKGNIFILQSRAITT